MTSTPHTNGSASPAPACPGQKGMAVPAGASDSGAFSSSLRASGLDATTHGSRVEAPIPSAPGSAHTFLLALPEPAPISRDSTAEIGALFEQNAIARIERLILLTDAHKARRRHASTKGIMRRLRDVTARLAGLGA